MVWLVSLVAVCLLAALFLAPSLRRGTGQRRAFQLLCDALEVEPRSGNRATGIREGVRYELRYDARRGPCTIAAPSLRIAIRGRSASGFTILPLDEVQDARAPAEGLSEVRTGDVDFDREVRLLSDAPEATEHFFANAVRRRAGRKLIELGASSVRLGKNQIEVVWSPFELSEETEPVRFSAAVSHLTSLIRDIRDFLPGVSAPSQARVEAGRALVRIASPLLLAAGTALSVWGARRFPPIDFAALATMASAVAFALFVLLVATLWALVGSARIAMRHVLATAFISVPAFLLAGLGLCILLNGLRDIGPVAVRTVSVNSRSSLCLFSFCAAHTVEVTSWRTGRKSERVLVPVEIYRRVGPGRRLLLTTKPGRLKIEWIREVSELQPKRTNRAAQAEKPQIVH
jgi:hypothetical protein